MTGARILVIDDEVHVRSVIEMKLDRSGFEVATAASGESGLELADSFRPDLVVTDYNMPGSMRGLELLRALRDHEATAHLPVILITGSLGIADRLDQDLPGLGNIVYIGKPFSPRDLVKRIREMLGEQPADGPSGNDD